MNTIEWLVVLGLAGGVIGYLEMRLGRQDSSRHALRNEILSKLLEIEREVHEQAKTLARIVRVGNRH